MTMLSAITHKHAKSQIVLVIPPPLLNDGFGKMQQSVINDGIPHIIRDIAAELKMPHEPVDMVELFGGVASPDASLLLEDGCHPSELGYEKMATKLFDVLSRWESLFEQVTFSEQYTNCAWNYDQLLDHACPDRNQPHITCSRIAEESSTHGRIRITFIGDSITQAHRVRQNESFPHKLQMMLGKRFAITNLGVSGATMMNNGAAEDGRCRSSFLSTPQWQMALESDADIFFVLLGTNDAKTYNWDPVRYKSDYMTMLSAIMLRHPNSAIVLVIPPPLLNDGFGKMQQSVINDDIPRIIQSINVEAKLPHEPVDMVELFGGAAGPDASLLLEDGCHPSELGYEKMATKLFDVLSQWEGSAEQMSFSKQYTNCAWNYDQLLDHACPDRNLPHATCSQIAEKTNTGARIRITFIGDSITQAHRVNQNESFPYRLQERLGERFAVTNLGVSGATVMTSGTAEDGKCPASFRGTPQWQMALANNADIFFVLLGTNDAKAYNWDPVRFESDYLTLLSLISKAHPRAEIVLMVPPPLIQDGFGGMRRSVVNHELPRIIRRIKTEANLHRDPIDMLEVFGGPFAPDKSLMLADGCHPNERGYEKMAAIIFKTLFFWDWDSIAVSTSAGPIRDDDDDNDIVVDAAICSSFTISWLMLPMFFALA
eukprot:TRINITY_DN5415_c0_g1_i6.p1 TRINITY_DN5415_c0_g1~~TRINITY_DN5415_c0_g1_i6.p1  ORF type:complete len:656 (-),score=122.96 TRINITY_DN5415_c0_g1_i6:280-2247(-)